MVNLFIKIDTIPITLEMENAAKDRLRRSPSSTYRFPSNAKTNAIRSAKLAEANRRSNESEDIYRFLCEQLECPVCYSMARPSPILQCKHGHVICNECAKSCHKCPICRESGGFCRNLVLEKMAVLLNVDFGINNKARKSLPLDRYIAKLKRSHRLWSDRVSETFLAWESDNISNPPRQIFVLTTILMISVSIAMWLDDVYLTRLFSGLLLFIVLMFAFPP